MIRRTSALVCPLILAACDAPSPTAPTQLAPRANSSGAVVQSVTGAGHFYNAAGFFRRLTVDARRYADGTVAGEWQFVAGATIIHGNVTCLAIDGSEARVGGIVEAALFVPNVVAGEDFGVRIVDNGQGATDPADQTNRTFFSTVSGSADEFCSTGATPFNALSDIIAGNFEIHR